MHVPQKYQENNRRIQSTQGGHGKSRRWENLVANESFPRVSHFELPQYVLLMVSLWICVANGTYADSLPHKPIAHTESYMDKK